MAMYLVDTENVGTNWFNIAERCADGHRCLLFFTEHSSNLTFIQFAKLMPFTDLIECIQCRRGPNGLDFQLATELGCRVSRNESAKYIVVSNDTDFDVVVQYWRDRGVSIKREPVEHTSKKAPIDPPNNTLKPIANSRESHYAFLFKDTGISEAAACEVAALAAAVRQKSQKKKWLADIYIAITKKFGQKDGLQIYHCIKPVLKTIMES